MSDAYRSHQASDPDDSGTAPLDRSNEPDTDAVRHEAQSVGDISGNDPALHHSASVGIGPRRHPLPGRLVWVVAVGVAGIVAVLDQATKVLAVEHLSGRVVDLGPVALRLVRNPNAAFGIPGFDGMFLIITVLVTVLIARLLMKTDRLWLACAYGLVVGGALGNGLDRAFREPGFPAGAVVDYIDIGWWPVFNVADSAISVGAVLLVVLVFRRDREDAQESAVAQPQESVRPETAPPGR